MRVVLVVATAYEGGASSSFSRGVRLRHSWIGAELRAREALGRRRRRLTRGGSSGPVGEPYHR